jgi:hypothetical protein
LTGVQKWYKWYSTSLEQCGNVESCILPFVEGIIFIFKVLEALDKFENLYNKQIIHNTRLEIVNCECTRFQGMQISPHLSKDSTVVAACPLKLGKRLDIFEQLVLLDHDIRWKETHDFLFKMEWSRWKHLRIQAQKDKIVDTNCLADNGFLSKLKKAKCITERLSVLFEFNAKYESILIDFDSLPEVNSVGQPNLKDVLVPLRTYF